jgi:hypothetical protein
VWGRTQDPSRRPASMQISGNTVTKVSDDFHYSTAVSRIQSFRHFFCEVLVHRAMRGTRIGAAPPAESALRRPGRALRRPPRRGPRPGAGCPSETPHVRTGRWQAWLRLEFRWTRTGAFPVRSSPACGRLAHAARPAALRSPAPHSPPPPPPPCSRHGTFRAPVSRQAWCRRISRTKRPLLWRTRSCRRRRARTGAAPRQRAGRAPPAHRPPFARPMGLAVPATSRGFPAKRPFGLRFWILGCCNRTYVPATERIVLPLVGRQNQRADQDDAAPARAARARRAQAAGGAPPRAPACAALPRASAPLVRARVAKRRLMWLASAGCDTCRGLVPAETRVAG